MDKRAKASPLKLGQRSDGPYLASWGASVLCSFSRGHEPGTDDVRNPLPLLSHEGTSLAWSTMALQSHPCKSGISHESLYGVTSLKPAFVLGFPSEGSHWTWQGSHHLHQAGPLLPSFHFGRKTRASCALPSPFHLSPVPLISCIRQQSQLQHGLHIHC